MSTETTPLYIIEAELWASCICEDRRKVAETILKDLSGMGYVVVKTIDVLELVERAVRLQEVAHDTVERAEILRGLLSDPHE